MIPFRSGCMEEISGRLVVAYPQNHSTWFVVPNHLCSGLYLQLLVYITLSGACTLANTTVVVIEAHKERLDKIGYANY